MDLEQFIYQTVEAIVDSTTKLQQKYSSEDVVINPPSAQSGSNVFQAGSENYTMRRVQNISFDVAVTAASQTSGSGGAGIKVMSLDIGGKGAKSISAEQVSRVSFEIPVTLKPSKYETVNKSERDRLDADEAAANQRSMDAIRNSATGY